MDDSTPSKRCPHCGDDLPRSAFDKNRTERDGLQSWCRACLKARYNDPAVRQAKSDYGKRRHQAKRAAMADELAERERQREQDRQGRRQAVQQNGKHCTRCEQTLPVSAFNSDARYVDGYQSYCRGCMRGYHTERRVDPTYTEGERKRGRDYYQQKREVIAPKRRAYDRGRWHTDPKYRQRKNIQKHQRREYLRGLVEHFTQEEWQALCEKYDNRCLKCGERKPLTVDHIVPVSKGGTNDIHNVQPLCLDCNMRKHTKTIDYRPLAQAAMGLDM